MFLWRNLGISSWPTFAIVGPDGKLLAQLAGEGHRKVLIMIFTLLSMYLILYFNVIFLDNGR